jgi:hypothetical protein
MFALVGGDTPGVEDEHDRLLRLAAFDRARELSRRYTGLVRSTS